MMVLTFAVFAGNVLKPWCTTASLGQYSLAKEILNLTGIFLVK